MISRTIKKLSTAFALVVLTISFSEPGAAGTALYKWLDERGRTQFSDRPPPKNIDYEVISTESSLKRVVPADEGAVLPEVKPRVGNEFKPVEKQQIVEGPKKNSEYCERARKNLETLQTAARLRMRDENGEFHFLEPEERETQIATAEAAIRDYC